MGSSRMTAAHAATGRRGCPHEGEKSTPRVFRNRGHWSPGYLRSVLGHYSQRNGEHPNRDGTNIVSGNVEGGRSSTPTPGTIQHSLGGPPSERLVRFFRDFARIEALGGILLLVATVGSLAWANSPWSELYFSVWKMDAVIGIGALTLEKPMLAWINDALMALFFLVIGLEIKRELLVGPLADRRRAALPVAAALGGMFLPAAIYTALNLNTAGARGWGIPMATDIAFALGVLALLGDRIPLGLKVFLVALAIADDIGAVLVIAFFYTAKISWLYLGVGGMCFACLIAANAWAVRNLVVYGLLGIGLWICFLKSGVHATVAGILLAATIPARARIDVDEFVGTSTGLLSMFRWAGGHGEGSFLNSERQAALYGLERACESVETPLQRLERGLHPWVTFAILPLFALANAGVTLDEGFGSALSSSVALGVAAGLLIGKPLGIVAFSWLAVRSGLAAMPAGVTWRQVWGVGCLAGIGFTMSLFIGSVALGQTAMLTMAKMGILMASVVAGVLGWALLRFATQPPTPLPSSNSSACHAGVDADSMRG